MTGKFLPALLKYGQQERRCLFTTESRVILWFKKMDLKKTIAAIRAPIKFRIVFYNFSYYF